jgi:hypothetical protein
MLTAMVNIVPCRTKYKAKYLYKNIKLSVMDC